MNSLQAVTRRAALAAFLLFAAAFLVVGPAEASRTTTDARPGLTSTSSDALAPSSLELSLLEPLASVDTSSRFGFAEDLSLIDVEARPCGFELFGGVETSRCVLTYARNNPLKYVDPDGRQSVSALRRGAVRSAWELERQAAVSGGAVSRNWSNAELQELIATGRVRGYVGHHINNVASRPDLAGDPANIRFSTIREHYGLHNNGRFRIATSGSLIARAFAGVQLASLASEAWGQYQEAQATGIVTSSLSGTTSVFDVNAAARSLDGQYIEVGGNTYYASNGGFYRAGCEGTGDDCKADAAALSGRTYRVTEVN